MDTHVHVTRTFSCTCVYIEIKVNLFKKAFIIPSQQGNAHENNYEKPNHPSQNGCHQKNLTTNAEDDVEEKKKLFSLLTGGTINIELLWKSISRSPKESKLELFLSWAHTQRTLTPQRYLCLCAYCCFLHCGKGTEPAQWPLSR